jgi:hypothetical protein
MTMRRSAGLSIRILSGIASTMLPFTTASHARDIAAERCEGIAIYVITVDLPQASPEMIERRLTIERANP